MNAIQRLSASYLRKGKLQQRFQSNSRPTVPLGSRILTDPAKVFEHNMWDHMQWSQEEEAAAKERANENSAVRVQWEDQVKYENEASKYWNDFYKTHKNKFFKDRNWLIREFPEIIPTEQQIEEEEKKIPRNHVNTNGADHFSKVPPPAIPMEERNSCKIVSRDGVVHSHSKAGSVGAFQCAEESRKENVKTGLFPGSSATFKILEVGCGAGNSVFPILNILNKTPGTFLYCCDFASGAVELIKSHSSYSPAQCSAFVHDVCDDGLPYPFPDGILDVILLVFVLSSIHPDRMQGVVNRLSKLLKPGGMVLFRDYGRYDQTQLRFKKGEVHSMFSLAGLDEVQNLVDRRLQVNRKRQVKMHRVWVQSKFQKPLQLVQDRPKNTIPELSAA
ncbi:mRNA N(3)-methylcytidine methyltransferase METTL8 isoform X3 [Ornithorhynchus anatinus]|uniref:tRNA N(3)-cytidine methyltransferase n=1 Tax=Ornithorhynchus anatinus TaxID=9258 RepID=A0A6I8P730_ORNAN|nr:mRNA N(3)-methylcytidine methyltransferase METTL8 isoform X3 [Ornithorhynchus anatinus]